MVTKLSALLPSFLGCFSGLKKELLSLRQDLILYTSSSYPSGNLGLTSTWSLLLTAPHLRLLKTKRDVVQIPEGHLHLGQRGPNNIIAVVHSDTLKEIGLCDLWSLVNCGSHIHVIYTTLPK